MPGTLNHLAQQSGATRKVKQKEEQDTLEKWPWGVYFPFPSLDLLFPVRKANEQMCLSSQRVRQESRARTGGEVEDGRSHMYLDAVTQD
jgi:hypothetical protein